jgi:hypothetical protein
VSVMNEVDAYLANPVGPSPIAKANRLLNSMGIFGTKDKKLALVKSELGVDLSTSVKAVKEQVEAEVYDALGSQPHADSFDIVRNDHDNHDKNAHTVGVGDNGRHGPDVQLNRTFDENGQPDGKRSIEGRLHGDQPWEKAMYASGKFNSIAEVNKLINEHIQQNWSEIRTALSKDGSYAKTFDAGKAIGKGFYNETDVLIKEFNMQLAPGTAPKMVGPVDIRHILVVIRLIPGNPPSYYVHTSYPNAVATHFGKLD